MKIAVAADHGGYELKREVIDHLIARGEDVIDLGTDSAESVDYPVYGVSCAEAVVSGGADLGIRNMRQRHRNLYSRQQSPRNTVRSMHFRREAHRPDSTITLTYWALGGRTTDKNLALAMVDEWLDTQFEGGRHQRRVDMLDKL